MTVPFDISNLLGVVAIGRNEGERLRACLESLRPLGLPVVFVDSGSTDGSPELAESLGADVLRLDPSRPFSAARARGEGVDRLLERRPELHHVFFVDGDCVVRPDWPERAVAALEADANLAAVCGRRRERAPESSPYNLLCDYEWDTPVGPCDAVGGDSVWRVSGYRAAGGFDPTVPAGEEPELCQRARDAGWSLRRLDAEMTQHDAAIHRYGAWRRRQVRTGYNGADVEARFGLGLFDRLLRGAAFWAFAYPAATLAAASAAWWFAGVVGAVVVVALACLGLVLQTLKIARGVAARPWGQRLQIATLTMLAKPAIAAGWLWWRLDRLSGKRPRLIEYKSPSPTRAPNPKEQPCCAPQ